MNIVACYKCVPEEEEIEIKGNQTLDLSKAQWKVGQYDLNAVEAGMQIYEEVGGTVSVLTAGDAVVDNSKLRKSILSRGPEQMYAVKDEALNVADSYATAQALKSAINKIDNVDLVLCGEGSGDIYSQQVGSVLGSMLGWACVNSVGKINAANGNLIVERSIESGMEVLEISLPAVVCVTSDINIPRIPAMKDILGAGKKNATVWSLSELNTEIKNGSDTISILAPEQTERLQTIYEGDSDENIDEIYKQLRKLNLF